MAYEIAQSCMLVDIGLTRSECASWVQAWGSIAAIIAAGAIAAWNFYEAKKSQQEQRREQSLIVELSIESISLHFAAAVTDIESAFQSLPAASQFTNYRDADQIFESFEGSLDAIRLEQLPSALTVNRVIGLRKAFGMCKAQYRQSKAQLQNGVPIEVIKLKWVALSAMAQDFLEKAGKAVIDLGG